MKTDERMAWMFYEKQISDSEALGDGVWGHL